MKQLTYVAALLRFSFAANPLLYASVAVSILSVAIELLAMSSLLPLLALMSNQSPSTDTLIARILLRLGVDLSATAFIWFFLVLLTVRIITQLVAQSLSLYLGRRVLAQLASSAFEQIVKRVPIREIGEKGIGYFISLAGDEAFRASVLVISITSLAGTLGLALFYLAAIAAYSLPVAAFVVVFLAGSGLGLVGLMVLSHRLGDRQTALSRSASSVFLDALNNLRAIRSFSAESYAVGLYRRLMFRYVKVLYLIDEVSLAAKLLPVLLLLAAFGGWFALAPTSIESAGLPFVVTIIVYLMRFFPTVGQVVQISMRIVSDAKVGRDVTEMLGIDWNERKAEPLRSNKVERIEIRDLGFSYGGSDKEPLLERINMTFERGKSYALVGRSGIGKSTLIDILLKFQLPGAGDVRFDGQSVGDLAGPAIRQRVILVSQEPAIFDDSVAGNILLGASASKHEIFHACSMACIDEEIKCMEHGLESRLQYQGRNLSGGQRQRIAIARALLRQPDVLILDESTSALDKPTQSAVVQNILREYKDKIVVFVTHDPEIMEAVDMVINLQGQDTETADVSKDHG